MRGILVLYSSCLYTRLKLFCLLKKRLQRRSFNSLPIERKSRVLSQNDLKEAKQSTSSNGRTTPRVKIGGSQPSTLPAAFAKRYTTTSIWRPVPVSSSVDPSKYLIKQSKNVCPKRNSWYTRITMTWRKFLDFFSVINFFKKGK